MTARLRQKENNGNRSLAWQSHRSLAWQSPRSELFTVGADNFTEEIGEGEENIRWRWELLATSVAALQLRFLLLCSTPRPHLLQSTVRTCRLQLVDVRFAPTYPSPSTGRTCSQRSAPAHLPPSPVRLAWYAPAILSSQVLQVLYVPLWSPKSPSSLAAPLF